MAVGRQIFGALPDHNRIVKREKERWSLENHRDESFADMYVHPHETDYNIHTLFELIDASGLEFIGFSNPQYWQLERLLEKAPALIERANNLSERDRYRLIELLDPEITHYEFFLGKPPLFKTDWLQDQELLMAILERHPCMTGWPSKDLFNYDYVPIELTEEEFQFIQACDGNTDNKQNLATILENTNLNLETVRSLQRRQLILLSL